MKSKNIKQVFLIILLSIFCTNFVSAQVVMKWANCYGGGGTDYIREGIKTTDGGYAYFGRSTSILTSTSGCTGGQTCLITKTDFNGNLLWQKCHGINIQTINSASQTADGGFIITGGTNSKLYLLKTDSLGNFEWEFYNGLYSSIGNDVKQTVDGGYIILGTTTSGLCSNGYSDFRLIKTDSFGIVQWEQCYGGTQEDEGIVLEITEDNGYILAGKSEYISGVPSYHGSFDMHLLKVDSVGNIVWQRLYGGAENEETFDIEKTFDGGYIVTGSTNSIDGDVTGLHNSIDMWVIKVDSVGTKQWQKCLGGYGGDRAHCIKTTSDGNYLVGGYASHPNQNYNWPISPNPTEYFGGSDFWIVKIDSVGSLIWQKSYGGSANETIYSIILNEDESFLIVGESNSINGNIDVSPLGPGAFSTSNLWVAKIVENYNTITGSLFMDSNSNGIADSNEIPIGYHKLSESTAGSFMLTDASGNFHHYVADTGSYVVTPDPINYYNFVPGSHAANFSGVSEIDSLNDFASQPTGPINDLCVSITPTGNFRSGFNASYIINYINVGTTILNPTILFLPDNNVSYVSSNPLATTVSPDTIQWTLGPLAPFQSGTILVIINVSTGLPIGTLINSAAIIEPIAGDNNPGCNTAYWEVHTTGSFDPNDVNVDKSTLKTTEFPNPPYLEYLVRFQNTGNDTAFFVNIRNNISPLLDINTFEVVATSHDATIEYSASSRLMTYKFENILLPHSFINEPASHGFIRYKIKPLDTLVVGDVIKNQASILFDYNAPVVTNTATTTVVLPTSESELTSGNGKINLFPNPTKDEINIVLKNLKGQSITLELYSVYGQKISSILNENIQSDHFTVTEPVTGLSKGIYFIRLQGKNGMWMSRFVKM